jgi:hypothetical protein
LLGSRDVLKTNYVARDIGAMKGLYGNSLEEAWYGGYVGDGTKPSVIRFTKATLPRARFFWSTTLYTLPDRFLYANPINRYSIGDRTKGLVDGKRRSLTIYVSNVSPGADKESNWLPAPPTKYSLVARLRAEPGGDDRKMEPAAFATRRRRSVTGGSPRVTPAVRSWRT